MLSDDPWSLVESIPRYQGPSVPIELGTQPNRPQYSMVAGSIDTSFSMSHGSSASRPVGTEVPMTRGTKLHRAPRQLATMAPGYLETSLHRSGISLATPLHREMGRQVPWPSSRLGTMVPRGHMSHDTPPSGLLGTSTIKSLEGYWDLGPWRSQRPWSWISQGPLSTKVPRHPAIEVPAIPRRPSGQAAIGNSVPSISSTPWPIALMGTLPPRVPMPSTRQAFECRMVPGRPGSRGAWGTRNPVVDGRSTGLIPRRSRRQGAARTPVPYMVDGQATPGSHGPSSTLVPASA